MLKIGNYFFVTYRIQFAIINFNKLLLYHKLKNNIMKVDINTKKVPQLITIPFLITVGIAFSVAIYGLYNALIW